MTELEINEIAEYYAGRSDAELERIATSDSQGLKPEVYKIIQMEIEKRGMNPGLLRGIAAQQKKYTLQEIESVAQLLQRLPCPSCGQETKKLNAIMVHKVTSFLVITSSTRKHFIACPNCLNRKNNDAIVSTLLLGWWGFPWGLLKTPLYIYRNLRERKWIHGEEPNEILKAFTFIHIGKIESFLEDKDRLREIIST